MNRYPSSKFSATAATSCLCLLCYLLDDFLHWLSSSSKKEIHFWHFYHLVRVFTAKSEGFAIQHAEHIGVEWVRPGQARAGRTIAHCCCTHQTGATGGCMPSFLLPYQLFAESAAGH